MDSTTTSSKNHALLKNDVPAALRDLTVALSIWDKTKGQESLLPDLLDDLGDALLKAKKPKEAIAPLQRAVDICTRLNDGAGAHRSGELLARAQRARSTKAAMRRSHVMNAR